MFRGILNSVLLSVCLLASPALADGSGPFFDGQVDPTEGRGNGFNQTTTDPSTASRWLLERLAGTTKCEDVPDVYPYVLQKVTTAFEIINSKSQYSADEWVTQKGIIRTNLMNAARKITTECTEFLNGTMRRWAMPLSNRNHQDNYRKNSNDFVWTVVGMARDHKNFKDFLTGDYLYYVNATGKTINGVPSYTIPQGGVQIPALDYRKADDHYDAVGINYSKFHPDVTRSNFARHLVEIKQHDVLGSPFAGAANDGYNGGVYTTYTAYKNFINQGTNRLLIAEVALIAWGFKIDELRSNQYTEDCLVSTDSGRQTCIWRNITRLPGGDGIAFKNTCRTCHGALDMLVPVWGKHDTKPNVDSDRELGVTPIYGATNRPAGHLGVFQKIDDANNNNANVALVNRRVHTRTVPNEGVIPWVAPYHPTPENFSSLEISANSPKTVYTVKQWHQVIADSGRFRTTMALRALAEMCMTSIYNIPESLAKDEGAKWAAANYDIVYLMERAATTPQCLGWVE